MSVCFPSKRGLRRDAKETVTIEIARARNVAPWSWGRMIGRFHNDRNSICFTVRIFGSLTRHDPHFPRAFIDETSVLYVPLLSMYVLLEYGESLEAGRFIYLLRSHARLTAGVMYEEVYGDPRTFNNLLLLSPVISSC